ncbi:Bifunctional solanapyrone synthase [Cytospora mali]|uniref:Bifunctional solanapyrone synthase n=1 Tax=Cytospora mali TaxID=578113 RepID=A0A194VTE8_CYTMA|nr:Bifunctional solanapyrone synthase [Valsa mali]
MGSETGMVRSAIDSLLRQTGAEVLRPCDPGYGLACDNVAAFEVVLADGRIVQASKTMNADLFWALKGGGNNFGIVTNIRMQAVKSRPIWGGLTMMSPQTIPQAAEALVDFTIES